MENENTSRRRFVRKLVSLAALGGITGLLLGQETEKVSAVGAANQIAYYTAPDAYTGSDNLRWYDTDRNFVAGYSGNTVKAGAIGATISGGGASGYTNKVTDNYGTVGGGAYNQAGNDAGTISDRQYATVSGGYGNTASGDRSTVGGGGSNTASGDRSTVGGGYGNTAGGGDATVGGGNVNQASASCATVGGGAGNQASMYYATVSGGSGNTASAYAATVGGGYNNTAASSYSFAAGRRAKIDAAHMGAFLFADGDDFDFNSSAANEFAVRATGGARFVTAIDGTGAPTKSFVMMPSGNLGVGTASPVSPIHVMIPAGEPASLIAIRAEGESRNVGAFFYSYSPGNFPFFSGRRARGTIASPSAVQANDLLMRYGGAGYGATSFPAGNRATLEFYAAENWTDTAQGTYVTIGTTATGSTATTERLRVTGDGNVVPPSDNTGSIGTASKRWALVRAVTITPGDLIFENGVKATEEGDGLAFVNPKGKKVAVLDSEGNFHIKGKIIQDL